MCESVTNPSAHGAQGFKWLTRDSKSKAINQWLFFSKKPPAVAAQILNDYANKHKLRDNLSPPKGTTLQDWVAKNTTPLWACLAALDLCLENGWRPETATEWAVYAYFLIRRRKGEYRLQVFSELIHPGLDRMCALGWVVAALEATGKVPAPPERKGN